MTVVEVKYGGCSDCGRSENTVVAVTGGGEIRWLQ